MELRILNMACRASPDLASVHCPQLWALGLLLILTFQCLGHPKAFLLGLLHLQLPLVSLLCPADSCTFRSQLNQFLSGVPSLSLFFCLAQHILLFIMVYCACLISSLLDGKLNKVRDYVRFFPA